MQPTHAPARRALRTVAGLVSGLLAALALVPHAGATPIGLSTMGTAYTQDFDSLASRSTSSSLPQGWSFSERGDRGNSTYAAGSGSSDSGNTYSFGNGSSFDRALGTLRGESVATTFGAQFVNHTGAAITSLVIAYTGEQWRAGESERKTADRLDFQFSLDASGLTDGKWKDYDGLDFASPHLDTKDGALNGNAAGNRTALLLTLTGLDIADGASFWIRWTDFDVKDHDDGLAVDDFSLTAGGASAARVAQVPEPGTPALLGLGLVALAAARRRR